MLKQADADLLINMSKTFVGPSTISVSPGSNRSYDLQGSDEREKFLLDVSRGTIRLSKFRFQTRARSVIVLVRLCFNGMFHTNPDGEKMGKTHLHVYREGYDDKWAIPLPPAVFTNQTDGGYVFKDFCAYCKISGIPYFQDDLV